MTHQGRGRPWVALAATVILAVGLTACGSSPTATIDFDNRVRAPRVRSAEGRSTASLRLAVTGLLTPTETLTGYAGFLAYLEERLGRPVELVQRGTYAELNALMQAGELDAALVCSLPYIQGHRAFGMELLAAPLHRERAVHYSYLVVPSESTVATLDDLRGGTFAFSDPDSHSGWLAPAYKLALSGDTPQHFFRRYFFSHHHSESIRAVADDAVDGAAVDSLVYDSLTDAEPQLVAATKVVERWGPYPAPPFVVRPDLDPDLKEELRQLLLGMSRDPQGEAVLRRLQLDGFATISDAEYDQVRDMEAVVGVAAATGR